MKTISIFFFIMCSLRPFSLSCSVWHLETLGEGPMMERESWILLILWCFMIHPWGALRSTGPFIRRSWVQIHGDLQPSGVKIAILAMISGWDGWHAHNTSQSLAFVNSWMQKKAVVSYIALWCSMISSSKKLIKFICIAESSCLPHTVQLVAVMW